MAGFLSQITPVIIVKDGEQHMEKTLTSLCLFSRVIVYDNGSSDNGVELARAFSNVEVIQGDFLGFGPTKNAAACYSKTPWVLSLDIDERPDDELLKQLDDWDPSVDRALGRILRKNYFCGKMVNTNGWGGDRLVRLYNRESFSFNDSKVHEKIEVGQGALIKDIGGSIHHDAIQDVSQILSKAQLYSELYAESKKARLYSFPMIVIKTLFSFFRSFVLRLGFLSGWRGCSIAVGDAVGVYFKYIKVYQRDKWKDS